MKNIPLLDLLPKSLIASLSGLPERLHFLNNGTDMVLAELRRGQELLDFLPPVSLEMSVARGRISIKDSSGLHKLESGSKYRVESHCEIRVLENCQLYFHARKRGAGRRVYRDTTGSGSFQRL